MGPLKKKKKVQPVGAAYLPRQLDHLEIPRAEAIISVHSPVGQLAIQDVTLTKVTSLRPEKEDLPSQFKVLVHQPCQSVPVFVLQSHPEKRTSRRSPSSLSAICFGDTFRVS